MTEFIQEFWLQAIFTGILCLMGIMVRILLRELKKSLKELIDDVKYLKDKSKKSEKTNRIIIEDRLMQKIEHHLAMEYCDVKSREMLSKLYEEYRANGGNGGMKDLMKRVFDLPLKPHK